MQSIAEYYGNFGPDAVREIALHLKRHGNLVPMLERFSLNVPVNVPDQHRVLRDFIFTYGVTFFLKALQQNMSVEEITRYKVEQLMSHSHIVHEESVALGHMPLETIPRDPGRPPSSSHIMPPVPPVAPAPPAAVPPPPVAVQQPPSPPAPPPASPSQSTPRASSPLRLRPYILMASYKGPDRRLNGDRRSVAAQSPPSGERRRLARRTSDVASVDSDRRGGDRRQRLDIILFANRRFGGDRRRKSRTRAR